ncbi:MAG: hypothetical protein FJX76_11720, partial [Armatimonadetes bacterium]|nr:hypothetical protein [Armatimonadota bacterium]
MKRLIGCVLTAILCLAPGAVWAAGAGSSDDTSTTETHTRTTYSSSSTSSTDTHRYVSGEAAEALQPNFLDN